MQHRIRAVEGENEWLKGMLRITKQSALAGGDHPSRLDPGSRKAGVGASDFTRVAVTTADDGSYGIKSLVDSTTPSESRDAKSVAPRRKGSPVGRDMRDSPI